MKAIQITAGGKLIRKASNRFTIRDYNLLNALAYLKGYKVSTTTKSIIMDDEVLPLRKVNGYIYAANKNISAMINDRVISTAKFLKGLK